MGVIDEIKEKLDVVDIIGDYVALQKTGHTFKALCPFHSEKTPSFMVTPEKQSWHCFGCGAGGDIFSFVMKKEGVDFSRALEMLAEKAGVTLLKKQKLDDEYAHLLYEVNEAAASYYHKILIDSPAARNAREYLQKRGISRETIENFQLGMSLSSRDALQRHFSGRWKDELVQSGLVVRRNDKTYDLFQGRLLFPIKNKRGKVLGFGGRVIDDREPKYINSPQTVLFNKSRLLYGIDRSMTAIKESNKVVVVEGYMDVLTAHQYGMQDVVASMGTSLTEEQLITLKGLTKTILFALDSDIAGDKATIRGLDLSRRFLERKDMEKKSMLQSKTSLDVDIRIINLPKGKDPDELIRTNPQEWQKAVEQALPIMDYYFNIVTSNLDLTDFKDKAIAKQQLLPVITELGDEIQRELYIKRLSQLIGVDEKKIAGEAARIQPTATEKVRKVSVKQSSGDPLEEYCLCLLLTYPYLRDKCSELLPEHFNRTENRQIYLIWQEYAEGLRDRIDTHLLDHLDSLMTRKLPPSPDQGRELELADCMRRLRESKLKRSQEELSEMFDGGSLEVTVAERKIAAVDDALKEVYHRMDSNAGVRRSNG